MARATVRWLLLLTALSGLRRAAGADGVPFGVAEEPLSTILERACPPRADRLVVVELFTGRCAMCRALERETFGAREVSVALAGDVCVRYDAEGEAGRPVAERFRVRRFPTTLFLDATGEEVDRLVGFAAPARFVAETARIRAGTQTLRSLRTRHADRPDDAPASVALGRRLVRSGELEAARALLEPIATTPTPDVAARPAALLGLAELAHQGGDTRAALAWIARLVESYPASAESVDARLLRVDVHLREGAVERAIEAAADARTVTTGASRLARLEETVALLERRRLADTIERWGERAEASGDVEALARAAREALDRGLVLGSAVRWAETVTRALPSDAVALETFAALLHETSSVERSLAIAERALAAAVDADDHARIARRLAAWRAAYEARRQVPPVLPPAPPPTEGDALPAPRPAAARGGVEGGTPSCPPAPGSVVR